VPVHEELYRCSICGEEEYSFEQMQAVEREAGRIYREQEGYLQPEEVRAMRERWGLTQAQLEAALGIGRKTVARWEAGRVLQQRSLDNLLRAIDQFPPVLAFLAARQSVELPGVETKAWVAGVGIRFPRSLQEKLEEAAECEGVDLSTLAVMLISTGLEQRSTDQELRRISESLESIGGAVAHWSSTIQVEEERPWLRSHRDTQRGHVRAVAS
jgi:putative zinc finger/helix-turn-helix YgiT family protein